MSSIDWKFHHAEPVDIETLSSLVPQALATDVARSGADAARIDPAHSDTAEFAVRYAVERAQCANCIVTASGRGENTRFAMALVPATHRLDTKAVQRQLGGKTSFAKPEAAAQITGMQFGAITPLGKPSDLPLFLAEELLAQHWVIVGGGIREIKVAIDPRALIDPLGGVVVAGLAMESAI